MIWRVALVVAVLLSGAAAAFGGWLLREYPKRAQPPERAIVTVALGDGIELADLAYQLREQKLIAHPLLFRLYARLRGAGSRLHSGSVRVRRGMTVRELLQRLAVGYGHAEVRVTLVEGVTRFDVADELQAWGLCTREAFVAASEDHDVLARLGVPASTAEGYIFPDTYRLHDGLSVEDMLGRFVRQGARRRAELFQAHAGEFEALRRELGFGPHDVVVLASIVEKEAAVADERSVIAGVFLNRLRDPDFRPKRLQADPTVSYGCLLQPAPPSCATFDGRHVTRRMTADSGNPYNTYRIDGLPPGPIGNPGIAALEAVLRPAHHGYYYFVADGEGRHRFSASLDDHNTAIQELRK